MPIDPKPRLAAVHYERGFDVNRKIVDVVTRLRQRGLVVGGVLQEMETDPDGLCTRLRIVDLRSGRSARITEDRGKAAGGCKLDPRGLAEITPYITDAIDAGTDLIVINKFGRAEAEGGGLLSCIAEALSRGVPVLTTVRAPYLEAWRAFHGGLAIEIPPSLPRVLEWWDAVARSADPLQAR
jgi:nucleoside-triphosphatase THEP1